MSDARPVYSTSLQTLTKSGRILDGSYAGSVDRLLYPESTEQKRALTAEQTERSPQESYFSLMADTSDK